MKKSLSLVALFLVVAATAAFGQTKNQDIRTLLVLMRADRLATQTMNLMIPEVEKLAPEVPQSFWDNFRKSVNTKSLIDLMVPIYARYYSDADVRQLIAFYRTPIGQKVVEVTPALTNDGFAVGQKWADGVAQRLLKKLKAAGYQVSEIRGQTPPG